MTTRHTGWERTGAAALDADLDIVFRPQLSGCLIEHDETPGRPRSVRRDADRHAFAAMGAEQQTGEALNAGNRAGGGLCLQSP